MKIKERIEQYGTKAVSEFELISLLTGLNVDVLNEFKTLKSLREQYQTIQGTETQITKLESLFEISHRLENEHLDFKKISSPSDVAEHFKAMKHLQVEEFRIVILNTKNHIIKTSTVSVGTLNASLVHPREVFKEAILNSAYGIILLHNHPSGDPSPSKEDLLLTERLTEVGKVMGIQVLDHIILGNSFYSFKEQGLI